MSSIALGFVVALACNDNPPPPSGPGDTLTNSSNDPEGGAGTQAPPPMVDAGADGPTYDAPLDGYAIPEGGGASMNYEDVQSPASACASCSCGENRGFCLENGVSATVTIPPEKGYCALAQPSTLAIGCNPLPAACAGMSGQLMCACLLDFVEPGGGDAQGISSGLSCFPACTSSGGYFDLYCPSP